LFDEEQSNLVEAILDAVSSVDETDVDNYLVDIPQAIAKTTAAVFRHLCVYFDAGPWAVAHAQSHFLRYVASPDQRFRIVHGDDALDPDLSFSIIPNLLAWLDDMEEDTLPARAANLLDHYGDEVDERTRIHWERIARKQEA
jgi:hypothetical protein